MIRKGTYILILDMPETQVRIGALGIFDIKEGSYCYVGSAMNGLDQRIGRHLSKEKKIRWHIDHLTKLCSHIEAYESSQTLAECEIGRIVRQSGGSDAVKGFGCSDCKCQTHLFILDSDSKEKLRSDPRFTPYTQQYIRS
ncbi:MAG: GIY-YIG nuclease family protein [Candidatus Methanoplasma sp.]|jgi:Uri superfamily endonuclease|nr:GIY-YIG nuclease family protein [Candidatus Methanoplasma sp.]